MPKIKPNTVSKAKKHADELPNIFCVDSQNKLLCRICCVNVTCDKNFHVQSHQNSIKHKKALESQQNSQKLASLNGTKQVSFVEKVTSAFFASDIPLKKIENKHIRELFTSMNHPLPSEKSCRNQITPIFEKIIEKIKSITYSQKIFIVFDESSIDNIQYGHILLGTIENPETTYLAKCVVLEGSLNSDMVCRLIDQNDFYSQAIDC